MMENSRLTAGSTFYICQNSCLCRTVNNRGKLLYCYSDTLPGQEDNAVYSTVEDSDSLTLTTNLLTAETVIWSLGLTAL